jgi:DNA-binding transcriptional regulator YdaS (Cro superfamily)
MRKQDVISHFGTLTAVATALEISVAAVSQWPAIIPEGAAYKVESVTEGELRVNPKLYRRLKANSKRAMSALNA